MVPLPRFKSDCDERFVVHQEYKLDEVAIRNMAFHAAYFASLAEAHRNLAEQFDGRFPDPEYLRHYALVECGYYTESNFVMDTAKDAIALASIIRKRSKYAVIRVSGNVVKVFDAKSQAVPAMEKEEFDASAKAVLDLVSSMARTTPAELKKNAGKSA